MCGEKRFRLCGQDSIVGSPPRVRGKVPLNCCGYPSSRITPACAGKSPSEHTSKSGMRDHPRVCGEKTLLDNRRFLHRGSPPRVRGKAVLGSFLQMVLGITPACAGKRYCYGLSQVVNGDHPRVCGEKQRTLAVQDEPQGSPPRVRGKAHCIDRILIVLGITPACAGKSDN